MNNLENKKMSDRQVFASAEEGPVTTSDGEVFTLRFIKGMPRPLSGPNAYLLYDGSIVMGNIETVEGKKWIKSFNSAGMTPMEISADKIIGWTSAAPRRGVFND